MRPEGGREDSGMTGVNYEDVFRNAIAGLKSEGRYRYFAQLERQAGAFPKARRHGLGTDAATDAVTVSCSNDYPRIAPHPVVLAATKEATLRRGAGLSGPRNLPQPGRPSRRA